MQWLLGRAELADARAVSRSPPWEPGRYLPVPWEQPPETPEGPADSLAPGAGLPGPWCCLELLALPPDEVARRRTSWRAAASACLLLAAALVVAWFGVGTALLRYRTRYPDGPLEGKTEPRLTCPGRIKLGGYGQVSLVPTGWKAPEPGAKVEARFGTQAVAHMGSRAYFAETCTAGVYDNRQYLAPSLLGKTIRYTVDLSGAGCGCDAAFYLVSMRQNERPSQCSDYYCDANSVCGEACAEIDIQEANRRAWRSTLHASGDPSGIGAGYGGGGYGWSGPRNWNAAEYGPGADCIDTNAPFQVAASFHTDGNGSLAALAVTLSQEGHGCSLSTGVDEYSGMAELSRALKAGMTPVISYWSSENLLWLDGKGQDWQGPCEADRREACAESVKFTGFSISDVERHTTARPAEARGGPEVCPGSVELRGYGRVSVVAATWDVPGERAGRVEVPGPVRPRMRGRAYFADGCAKEGYDSARYVALPLLGRTLRYTVDLSGAGCGCNAALYLTSLQQNSDRSGCKDYYCDANSVCGVSCAEIDIQEANRHAFYSTLHASGDRVGTGVGYGATRREWNASVYGPGARCIDTSKPFVVATAFHVDASGRLKDIEVSLSQRGRPCRLSASMAGYRAPGRDGMAELSRALEAGMTPIISYWGVGADMLWMDGRGGDGQGPCDQGMGPTCAESVEFSGFSLE